MKVLEKIGQLNNTAQTSTSNVLFATLKTVIQMLGDRGYTNIQACQTIEEIVQNMQECHMIACGAGPASIAVYFHNEERVGVKQLRAWLETSTADHVVVVSLEGPTSFTRKEAENNYNHVQFFQFKELCVNITRHVLVPKHEKVDRLPTSLVDSTADLPIIYTSDRVVQYYAFKAGDVLRITRTAGVQEPVYYYRIVQNAPSS